jgi:hypothetical protein
MGEVGLSDISLISYRGNLTSLGLAQKRTRVSEADSLKGCTQLKLHCGEFNPAFQAKERL